jgi:hypothetical protein
VPGSLRAEAELRRVKANRTMHELIKAPEAVVGSDRVESGVPLRENI